jgi:diguanylate cyclase (GGDEF)-like protein
MLPRARLNLPALARAWVVYLVLGCLVVAAYFTILAPSLQDPVYNLLGISSVGATALGIWRWRPARQRAWILLAVGVALGSTGDILVSFLTRPDGTAPFPSVADAAYLLGYVVIAIGLVGLVRDGSRDHERVAWIDALIVASAAGIFIWVFVIRGEIGSSSDALSALVAAAYPFLDIVQIAVVVHLLLRGQRTPSLVLLGWSFGASLVADLVYAKMSLDGTYAVGQLVDAGWLLGYVALGVAALHPSMARSRAEPAAQDARRTTLTLPRLLLLAGAGMSGPAVVALETMRGDAPDAFAVAVGLSVVYLLVLWRAVLGLKSLEGSMRERGRLTLELAEQANHDPLTGLANRRLFLARLDAALAHPEPDRMVAMLYLDLDRIKAINDSKGHAAGDAAIATVSERLRVGLRSADTVARLGGDEFGILLTATTREAARKAATRVNALIERPVSVGEEAIAMSASVGLAFAEPGDGPNEVIRNADQAMYRAKSTGGASFVEYSDVMRLENAERLELQAEMSAAIGRREFVLYYQPIVDLQTGAIVGLEALVRWSHPTRGLLLPGSFIPLAEQTGLIVPLGRWIFQEAVRQVSDWQREGLLRRELWIDVNVAARQLADPRFTRDVAAAISGTGMGAGRIAVELTETELIRDPDAVGRSLATLRRGGLRVLIDDFGTAYASMSHFVNFPIDGLKIDRQFVWELEATSGPGRALVSSMVRLAAELGIWAVAEGVETERQAQVLREIGCPYAQGFLFSRPVPADTVANLLRAGAIALPTTRSTAGRSGMAAR